ncbi:MAG: beta-galactosidase, partial [Bacteroidetes bacterium]|nr:beta-galactosidase [Bacteroidota bacterium]
ILLEAIKPNFWRPTIDIDFGGGLLTKLDVWNEASNSQVLRSVQFSNNSKILNLDKNIKLSNGVTIETVYDLPSVKGQIKITYKVNASGEILVTNELKNLTKSLPHLPRFGNNFIINNDYQVVEWFGRGPFENYIDRNTAALVGIYKSSVEDLYFPYIRPQENGYKTDVRWVSFKNTSGQGIKIEGAQLLGFSTHHQYNDDFDTGKSKQQRHTTDIKKRDFVNINIDYGQSGVGGDDSWTSKALPHEEFRIKPNNLNYSYRILPVK